MASSSDFIPYRPRIGERRKIKKEKPPPPISSPAILESMKEGGITKKASSSDFIPIILESMKEEG